jgi:tripartite-type tricarboxylate transporter receptor subunit TctC
MLKTLVTLALAAAMGCAQAQNYPSKPIRWILSFTAGIGTDVFARRIAPIVGDQVGQPILVENRPGAAGAIGAEAVYKSPPDGYTYLFSSSAQTVALPHSVKALPYDANGFTPVMAAI